MVKQRLAINPFDSNRYIGSVTYVSPDTARLNLPYASSATTKQYAGYPINGGQVGELVFIESEAYAVLGRITEVRVPDNERLKAEPTLGKPPELNPIGFVQLLTSVELATGKVVSGIPEHPRIGQHVFSAHPLLIKHVIEGSSSNQKEIIELATTDESSHTKVNLSPSQLFGRHCAVLGATGGGKSWTVARLIQEVERIGGKAILFDPTGEFYTLEGAKVEHVYFGGCIDNNTQDKKVYMTFPYWELTEFDLFAIFQPSGASQTPKFREALRSLKLMYVKEGPDGNKNYIKAEKSKKDFRKLWEKHKTSLEAGRAKYLISHLPQQIIEECVWENGGRKDKPDPEVWGGYNEQVRGYCETLVSKVQSIIHSKALECLFNPEESSCIINKIKNFLNSDEKILRISMEDLPFEHNARELLANALGRYLLGLAREGRFIKQPTVIFLDEAHQFLNKKLGDENNQVSLDAFGLIAKEGRKYGLTITLATQRPRDIPEDVLSQMGMFIVHRLINERDRQIVEKACGHLDGSAAFLPTLGQGEAMLVGVDFPMPTPVKIIEPSYKPKSEGPNYSKYWNLDSK